MAKDEVTWVFPNCTSDELRNVWVMVTESKPQKGVIIRSLRVFSTEPPDSVIEWQKKLHEADESPVTISVLPVSLDYFDIEELEAIAT